MVVATVETSRSAPVRLGQPINLFRSAFTTYLRRNGWQVHHYDKHGEPFWRHPSGFTTFATHDAVTQTPRAQQALDLPVRGVLVTNVPALGRA